MQVISAPEKIAGKILVHICCGPDATYGTKMIAERFGNITGYYYNPNIWPREEYYKRLEETRKVAALYSFDLIEGSYEEDEWKVAVSGFEEEPEKGRRCEICIGLRLEECARLAREEGFRAFTTVLSISPKKDAAMINRIGREIGKREGLSFIELDLKKKDGFKKSVEISKEMGLYRQNYCGCKFSFR